MDFASLDESFINNDDSFLLIKSEEMDDEVVDIIKKWNIKDSSHQKKTTHDNNEANSTFSSKTFTRSKKSSLHPSTETESKINSINLQVGGPITHSVSMKKSWLGDVSPPNSMDSFSQGSIMRSLITSSDFSNVSGFLLNDDIDTDKTITPRNMPVSRNLTFKMANPNKSTNATFSIDMESPMKEFGVENVDISLTKSTEDLEKNSDLTFDCLKGNHDVTTIVQSTPIHSADVNGVEGRTKTFEIPNMTPLSPNMNDDFEDDDDDIVPIRKFKSKRVLHDIDAKRESLEDQYEFLLNEETIKLSTRVCGQNKNEMNATLVKSEHSNETEFDQMLDSLCVNTLENKQILHSLNNYRQKYPFNSNEKKQSENHIEKSYKMTLSSEGDRLLKRERLYDNINIEEMSNQILEKEPCDNNTPENHDDRDRFKTIKLNRKPRNGMVDVNSEPIMMHSSTSSSSLSSENIVHQNKGKSHQENHPDNFAFKKPVPSKLSKFGFSKLQSSELSRNEWKFSHKANSIDNLDNTSKRSNNEISGSSQNVSSLGVKSKSINNLLYSKTFGYGGSRTDLKLKPAPKSGYQSQSDNNKPLYSSRQNMVGPSSGYYRNTQPSYKMNTVLDSNKQENMPLLNNLKSSRDINEDSGELKNTKAFKPTGAIPRPPSGLRPPTSIPRTSLISGLPRPNMKR